MFLLLKHSQIASQRLCFIVIADIIKQKYFGIILLTYMYYTTRVFNVTLHVHHILPALLLTTCMSYVDEKFEQHIVIRMLVHLMKCTKSNFVL